MSDRTPPLHFSHCPKCNALVIDYKCSRELCGISFKLMLEESAGNYYCSNCKTFHNWSGVNEKVSSNGQHAYYELKGTPKDRPCSKCVGTHLMQVIVKDTDQPKCDLPDKPVAKCKGFCGGKNPSHNFSKMEMTHLHPWYIPYNALKAANPCLECVVYFAQIAPLSP